MAALTRVALVRSDDRRGAVATALHLIADDLARVVTADVLLKPNLVSHRRQLPSTHADAFAATLDAVFAAGARRVTVAEGASDARAGFERFGFGRMAAGRDVAFFDINRDEARWRPITLSGVDFGPLEARLSDTVAGSTCRVSLALMKTHVNTVATMSLKNMLSSLHPDDRVRMHGHAGGNGSKGWKRLVVEFLKGDNTVVNLLTRTRGRYNRLRDTLRGIRRGDGLDRFSPSERRFLRSIAALDRNLATLAGATRPHVSVLDGFVAMHREGPRHGTPIKLGVAIAGTDPVAVDAVGAAVMGFQPGEVDYLNLADRAGVGTADLARIEVVGDPIAAVMRRCVPHSHFAMQRAARRVQAPANVPAPHYGRAGVSV